MGTRINFMNIFSLFNVQMILIWFFPAGLIYDERFKPAERVNDQRHSINLRLFDWRIPALVKYLKEGVRQMLTIKMTGRGRGCVRFPKFGRRKM